MKYVCVKRFNRFVIRLFFLWVTLEVDYVGADVVVVVFVCDTDSTNLGCVLVCQRRLKLLDRVW